MIEGPTKFSESNALLAFVGNPEDEEGAEQVAREHLGDYSLNELRELRSSINSLLLVVQDLINEKMS